MDTSNTHLAGDTGGDDNTEAQGDTDAAGTSGGDGDTSTAATGSSEDSDALQAANEKIAALEAKVTNLTADRDKASRKREQAKATADERLTELENSLADERNKREAAEKRVRISETTSEVLGQMHADHRNTKTAERLVRAIQAEGVDFAAEDRAATVKAATDALRKDHPEMYAEAKRAPGGTKIPEIKNGAVSTAKGPRLL